MVRSFDSKRNRFPVISTFVTRPFTTTCTITPFISNAINKIVQASFVTITRPNVEMISIISTLTDILLVNQLVPTI